MSLPEVVYRFREASKKKLDRRTKINFFPSGSIDSYPNPILFIPANEGQAEYGKYSIFGNLLDYVSPIAWHRDIMNNKEFPRDFSFSIDTRSGRNGNVKVVWEVNRLQFLSDICLKYQQTEETKYLNQFISIIESWKAQNPYLIGVNWYSNIEVNLRIINWFVCWEVLEVNKLVNTNERFKTFVENVWLPLIELHGMHAFRYESKFSSSNNHLIAEASGLFIAGSYWSFKDSEKWRKKGQKILEEEIKKQHSRNGINKEEASEYIQFITDFFLIAYIVGDRNNHPFSSSYKSMLKHIFDYINNLMDASGRIPYYGDDDDGKVLYLGNPKQNNFQSLLASAAVLFGNSKYASKGSSFDIKNELLFGEEGSLKFHQLPEQRIEHGTKTYKKEGHFLVKKGRGASEIYLHVDVAPLGYLSIAAHGHADALSFFLHMGGSPFIIDPGTYTYHSYPDWRAYFKGTLAHNTIRVDRLEQATNGGPCLWLDHFSSELMEVKDDSSTFYIKGSHDGYQKVGVRHTRSYLFDKIQNTITIHDQIETEDEGLHFYEIPLHLHPEIVCNQQGSNQFELINSKNKRVQVVLDHKVQTEIVKGSTNPILGWYSPSFLQKVPTSVIYSTFEYKGDFELKTEIHIH